MAVTITVTPASPVAKLDVCRFDIAGADSNRADHSEYRYYLSFEVDGNVVGKSYIFNVGADGKHQFFNYIFPESGSFSVIMKDAVGDGTIKSQAVTVS
jgi:hypothetical protein